MNPALARKLLLRWPGLFVRCFVPDDAELGKLGEEVAARELSRRGYRILARCLRTCDGEADLVVAIGSIRAVVEVKTGRASVVPRPRGAPATEVDLRWRPGFRCDARRLARLASVRRRLSASRVDLVEVFYFESTRRFRALHHEDIRRPLSGTSLEGSPADLR